MWRTDRKKEGMNVVSSSYKKLSRYIPGSIALRENGTVYENMMTSLLLYGGQTDMKQGKSINSEYGTAQGRLACIAGKEMGRREGKKGKEIGKRGKIGKGNG